MPAPTATFDQRTVNGLPLPRIKPTPPLSPWITPTDQALLKGVLESIGGRKYIEADQLRQAITAPTARSVADWAYYRSSVENISSQDISLFLDRHFGWPDITRIQSKAERNFDDDTPAEEIIAFFAERDPETGNGHLQLARAFLKNGNKDAGRTQLRQAWVDHDWSSSQERNILSRYAEHLTPNDHWAKADRQLFDLKATATTRLLPKLSDEKRQEARVRIAFIKNDRNGPVLYNRHPQKS
ncbi:MAG: hypothetical protein AAF603_08515, partial [Pseudomonadota bacterium]